MARVAEHIQLGVRQAAMQFGGDSDGNERAAVGVQQQHGAGDVLQPRRQVRANENAERVEDGGARPFFLLGGEPGPAFGRQRVVVEPVAHENVGPALFPAFIQLAAPDIDALDRRAEMGAVAHRDGRHARGARQRRGQRHRAADGLADEMKPFDASGVGDGEDVGDQLLDGPWRVGRGNDGAAVAAHVEAHEAIAVGEKRLPIGEDLRARADAVMKQYRRLVRPPWRDAIDDLVMQRAMGGRGQRHRPISPRRDR